MNPLRADGHRLSDPHDPAVRDALTRTCPTCNTQPNQWCIGVGGTAMRGRILTRIHAARCTYHDTTRNPDGKPTRHQASQ